MEFQKVCEAVANTPKGSFVRVGFRSKLGNAEAKKQGISITKETTVTGRIGINYNNIATVKARKAEQTEAPTREFKIWFKHVEGRPEIIEHLQDAAKRYLQIFTAKPHNYPKVKYFIDGQEVSKQELEFSGLCTKTDLQPSSTSEVFNIPLENIMFIGNYR